MSDEQAQEVLILPGSPDLGSGGGLPDGKLVSALLNAMPGGAAFIDPSLCYLFANRQFLAFFGRDENQLIGKSADEIYPSETIGTFRNLALRALAGETVKIEGPSLLRGGDTFVRQSFTPYILDDGTVAGIIILGFDLTALKQQERQIAAQIQLQADSEALNKAIVDNALDCIVIIDENSTVVDFNPTAERVMGFSRAEVIGRDIADLIIPPAYRNAHHAGMKRFLENGESKVIGKRLELEAVHADGTLLPVELAIGEVHVGNRRLFTAHIRDLSATRAAQKEIERQREALYQKEKLAALGSLLSGVAHELNNPLSIVIGQTMMLREKAMAGPINADEQRELAERSVKIETAANRCARIVKSFLAMARQRQTERRKVDIATIINEAIELLSYSLRTSSVRLECTFAPDLPPILADGDQIHQVLVNLIVNSRQALEDISDRPRQISISARLDESNTQVLVSLTDNGPGIAPSIRTRIFDPFFTTKSQDHGTGIGLAVSRGLIEAHGGVLELAEPLPVDGAHFLLRLPLAREDDLPIHDPAPPEPDLISIPKRKTVLVVDDETEIAELIGDIVSGLGYHAITALSGQQAQALVLATTVDISAILCDIRMPDGDGPSFYDWLSEHRPPLCRKIGFVTGDTLGPSAGRFLARTGCPVIEKPFSPSDINRVLAELSFA